MTLVTAVGRVMTARMACMALVTAVGRVVTAREAAVAMGWPTTGAVRTAVGRIAEQGVGVLVAAVRAKEGSVAVVQVSTRSLQGDN